MPESLEVVNTSKVEGSLSTSVQDDATVKFVGKLRWLVKIAIG